MASGNYQFGLADNSGQWILEPDKTIRYISYAGEGRWDVTIDQGYCKFVKNHNCSYFVDFKGKNIPEVEFVSRSSEFSEGLAAVEQSNGKLGYINRNGNWGISPDTLKKSLAYWYKKEADALAEESKK